MAGDEDDTLGGLSTETMMVLGRMLQDYDAAAAVHESLRVNDSPSEPGPARRASALRALLAEAGIHA